MPLTPVEHVGAGGMVTDVKPYQLQENQWSGGNNISFRNGEISKINGYAEVMKDCPIEPWHLATYQEHDSAGFVDRKSFYWIVFGEKEIWVHNNNTWSDITRESGEYNGRDGSDWDVTQSGALLIATNGVDIPQIWPLTEDGKISVDNHMEDMESWVDHNTPGETDLSAQTVEGFKNHIIVTGVRRQYADSSVEDQNRLVKWSTQHGHYAEPVTWDVTDKDHDAGEYELLDTQGPIVDTLPMGELFMIYKADSIYMMSYVGTPYIFSFKTLSPQIGIISKGAATEFPGGHFFVSYSDCYINNGQTVTPLLTGKVRGEMYNNINGTQYQRIFAVTNTAHNEVWACFPSANSLYPDKAMVWNYKDNTFSFRDLPKTTDIKAGMQVINEEYYKDDPSTITWDSVDPDPSVPESPWSGASTVSWGSITYSNVVANLVMCSPDSGELYRDNIGQTENGKMMHSYVERTGIDFGDPSSVKHLRAVWPKISTRQTATIDVYTGYQMGTDDAVTWEGPSRFNPDHQSKISVRTTGKLLALRFETKTDTAWAISGLELEYAPAGSRGSRNYA